MDKKLSELKEEEISAFAYNTGKSLETFIKAVTDNLEEKNKDLEIQILTFEDTLEILKNGAAPQFFDSIQQMQAAYREHFGIKKFTGGAVS